MVQVRLGVGRVTLCCGRFCVWVGFTFVTGTSHRRHNHCSSDTCVAPPPPALPHVPAAAPLCAALVVLPDKAWGPNTSRQAGLVCSFFAC